MPSTASSNKTARAGDIAASAPCPVESRGVASVRIHLIGPMRAISYLGDSVLPRGRKARAILACLSLANGERVLRSTLAGMLWDRVSEDQARASLRQALRELNDALAACNCDAVFSDRDGIQLDTSACWIDALALPSVAAAHTEPEGLTLLGLCNGRLLEDLDGTSAGFDQWLLIERSKFAQRTEKQCDMELARSRQPEISVEARLAIARRIIAIDPGHEQATRLAMKCLAEMGEPAQALREYARCRDAMRRLLDLTPSKETIALRDAIRLRASLSEGPGSHERENGSTPHLHITNKRARLRVAVAPFSPIGTRLDPHLPLALAQDAASALARFRWFDVIAPVSLQNRNLSDADLIDLLKNLDVDYVVMGTAAAAPDRVRISVQLHEIAEHAEVVWREDFEVDWDAMSDFRDHITGRLVARIDPMILFIEGQRPVRSAPRLAESTTLLLRAIPLIYSMQRANYEDGGRLLLRANELDPNNAMIAAWRAYWHVFEVGQGWTRSPNLAFEQAETLCVRAMRLDPNNAEALGIYAHVRSFLHKDFDTAQYYFDRSLHLNPNLAFIWALSAPTQCYIGNPDEALVRLTRYSDLAPFDPYFSLFESLFTMAHTFKGDYRQAVVCGRRSVGANPDFTGGYKPLIAALGHLGLKDEASRYVTELCARDPNFSISTFASTYPIRRREDRDRYVAGLRLAGVPEA